MRYAGGDHAAPRSYIIRAVQQVDPRTGLTYGMDHYRAYWSDGTARVDAVFPAVAGATDQVVRETMGRRYPQAAYVGTYGDITTRRFRFPALQPSARRIT